MSYFRRMAMRSRKVVPVDGCIHATYNAAAATTAAVIYRNNGGVDWVSVDGIKLSSPTAQVALTAGEHDVAVHISGANIGYLFQRQPITALSFASLGSSVAVSNIQNIATSATSLESVELGDWTAASVTNLYEAFYDCSKLSSLDVGSLDVGSCANFSRTFRNTALDLSGVSKWRPSAATLFNACFYSNAVTEVYDLEAWELPNVTSMKEIFRANSKLQVVKMPRTFDPTGITFEMAFLSDNALTAIYVPSEYLTAYQTALANANVNLSKLTTY